MPKSKKLALNSELNTPIKFLKNDDEVCIPHLSSILLPVPEEIQIVHAIGKLENLLI